MKQYRVQPKSIDASVHYNKDGELDWRYANELAKKLESIVLKYFDVDPGITYYGRPHVAYCGFHDELPYVFSICADPPKSNHYPELYFIPGKSMGQFKGEIDYLLSSEGFNRCTFDIRGKRKQLYGIDFER
jgi:hypothetical protein